MHFYGSRSGHLLAERRKLLPNTAAIQEVHTHDTNTYTQQAPAVGHWHSLPSASCSEPYGKQAFQFCSKPHQHRLRLPGWQSQPKRKGARGQRSQIPPCCWCDPSRKGLRHVWCRREKSREPRAVRCCSLKAVTTSVCTLGTSGSSVDNLAAAESCRVNSDVINGRKKK